MDLLFITPYIPFPLTEGGKISQFAMIDYLRSNQNITLVLLADEVEKLKDISSLKSLWPNVDIETIATYEKKLPKKSTRRIVIDRIKSLKAALNKETISLSPQSDFDRSDVINLTYLKSRDFIKQLSSIINKKKYDLAQIDFLDFIDLVNLIPVNTKKIFVHHEIRFARLITGLNSDSTVYQNYIIDYVKAAEAKMLSLYDGILVFSDDDKKKLEDLPELNGKVFNSPFPILNADFIEIPDTNEVINKITFIGGDTHYPNFDAVQWFTNEIIPVMHSSLQLHVVGIWNKENMDIILEKSKGKVIFSGFVDDLIMYCKNSIMVVPLRLGSGIRTKILYAMAHGTPIISTSIGCEGLGVTNLNEMVIADSKQEFADAIVSLTQDVILMKNLVKNAQNFAKTRYSQDAAGSVRLELIKSITLN